MKTTHRAAAGAAALLAVGAVAVGTAGAASAAPARINASQLSTSIAHAVTLEQQGSTAALYTGPAGRAAQTAFKAACSA
jgi:hypothetical protein